MDVSWTKCKNVLFSAVLSVGVLLGGTLLPADRAYADDFIDEIDGMYQRLYEHYSNQYKDDYNRASKEYDWLIAITSGERERLEQAADADLRYLLDLFNEDFKQLDDKYGNQRDYRDKLTEYRRAINPDYSSGPMWEYNKEINKNYSSRSHWKLKNEINPDYSFSTMWNYRNTTNPNYSSSTMWNYRNDMNPNYSSGLMWELKNESNPHYSSGTMWNYRQGNLTLADARKKMDEILTKGAEELQEARDKAMTDVTKTRKKTVDTLFELRDETLDIFQSTRAKSLKEILSIRERHFGGSLDVKPLVIGFDPIKVLIDKKLLSFEQPPVLIDGNTLVPMRAIFEQLGAKIEWNQEEYSVTATKGNTTIYLKIGDKQAKRNGETINLEVPAQLVQSNTMVPVRFISESLGAHVEWDDMTKTVVIETK
ncbi:copper amine oxidase N-terminal domain-containing protein [Paenibacillus sp. SAFN-117]|uniref:copper amine oxidase N-terminal domain-containing protein n=1 Tax=Paenibacillus sp. SAFN-117 TaxID=3436860 RepID=UPI003F7DD99D